MNSPGLVRRAHKVKAPDPYRTRTSADAHGQEAAGMRTGNRYGLDVELTVSSRERDSSGARVFVTSTSPTETMRLRDSQDSDGRDAGASRDAAASAGRRAENGQNKDSDSGSTSNGDGDQRGTDNGSSSSDGSGPGKDKGNDKNESPNDGREDNGAGGGENSAGSAADEVEQPTEPEGPCRFSHVSYLCVGQRFSGSQTVSGSPRRESDEWRVNVHIQALDLERGTVSGSMEALDVPKAESPVVTFWHGEIIDNNNYYFWTRRWGAEVSNDMDHWNQFAPFAEVREAVQRDGGDDLDLSESRYVFMRWKERFFVNVGEDCGLTIAGFYYLCLDRRTGHILGYYYDPRSEPFQRLQLTAKTFSSGLAFANYDFH